MAKIGRTKTWVATAGVVLLFSLVAVPALSGAASAAAAPGVALPPPATQWAYGGEGWSNHTFTAGNATLTWDAMFGWSVIFTSTPGAANVTLLEEQRTLGISIQASYTTPVRSLTYTYHGQEVDTAFANLTNASVVYVSGQAVPALGILNASASVTGAIDQSVSLTAYGATRSASLDVNGFANASVRFAPSLGLIPLNLTGVSAWNSSAVASPSANWDLSWTWSQHGFNGTTGSGAGSKTGSVSATGPVNLTGAKVALDHSFLDHKPRVAVVLAVTGPFDLHDGFVLVPHDFDMFGDASHAYDSLEFGSAAVSSETLYLSGGAGAPALTAADTTFGADDSTVSAMAAPTSGLAPTASTGPSATIQGQPMSVAEAQSVAKSVTQGFGSLARAPLGAALAVGLIALAVVLMVGTVGVVEWRSYARRKSQTGLVGGYATSWPNGVPPAAATSPPAAGSPPTEPPASVEGPARRE